MLVLYAFFFFQAEDGIRDLTVTGVQTCVFFKEGDGIRDLTVTGVQTCALPISASGRDQSLNPALAGNGVVTGVPHDYRRALAPRLGIAYAPHGSSTTVFRAGLDRKSVV